MSYYEYTMEKLGSDFLGKAFTTLAKPIGVGQPPLGAVLAKTVVPLMAGTYIGGMGLKMMYDKFKQDRQAVKVLEDLMHSDPIISKEDPETVKQYAATVFRVAPSISHDKNVMKNLLQNFIKFGTVDMKTIETLAGIQKTMDDSHNKTFPFATAPLMGKLI